MEQRRIRKANLRNTVYPKNVDIDGVKNESFRIFEVVADGRCLFGTIWLLTRPPAEINQLLSDTATNYKGIEDFNDNGGLNDWIKGLFSRMTNCQKIKMMESYFLEFDNESAEVAKVLGDYDGENHMIELYCSTDSVDNTEVVDGWYQKLTRSGVVGKFDQYLLSLYTNQTASRGFEASYRYADIELLGDFLSDTFRVNINLVQTPGKTPYEGGYRVNTRYIGKPDKLKRDIYIYYKSRGHFQPMIPTSILDPSNRGQPGSVAVSSLTTTPKASAPKSKTVASSGDSVFARLKDEFPDVDDDVINTMLEVTNNNYEEANDHLIQMEMDNSKNKENLKKLLDMGYEEEKSKNALELASNDLNFAITILQDGSNSGTPRESFDSQNSAVYNDFDEPAEGPHSEDLHNDFERLVDERDACLADKKFLYEYFTFPKRLKIKYVVSTSQDKTLKDLPSTGRWGKLTGKTSTTDRIQPLEEDKPDSVYYKLNEKFTNPNIQKVEIFNGDGRLQTPETYKNATENWYFLVTLGAEPVFKGGRTRKRHPQRGGMRSHKKRKMRTRGRRTKRLSLTKRRKYKSKKIIS